MDISLRIFLNAEEFVAFLEEASALGGGIWYEPRMGASHEFVQAGQPLPTNLTHMLRSPLERGSPHLLHLVVGSLSADSKVMNSQTTVDAYFGGIDRRALYMTSISVRSVEEVTLAFMRRLKRSLMNVSRTGVAVLGADDAARKLVPAVRYTRGAEAASQSGLELRQRGVENVRYGIIPRV